MAVPEFQTFLVPTLRVLKDGKARHWREEVEPLVVEELGLTEADYEDVLPSGLSRIRDRVGWAATYLAQAELIVRPTRGFLQITALGLEILAQHPDRIDRKILSQFTGFDEFLSRRKKRPEARMEERERVVDSSVLGDGPEVTPTEVIGEAVTALRKRFTAAALDRIRERGWRFLEQLSVELVSRMSYGRHSGKVEHTGKLSGDGGIDGVVWTDELGTDRVYVQAKCYEKNVQLPDAHKFAGALQGLHANRGVMVTTSGFSSGVEEYARAIGGKIALIDGPKLVELMIKYQVGIRAEQTFTVYGVDENVFNPDNLNPFDFGRL